MSGLVDRYTPSEPYPRLVVPITLTTTFLSLFALFALTAINQYGPITDVHVSYLAIPAVLFLAFLASARGTQVAVRDVADRAEADGDGTAPMPVETGENAGDRTDPVSTLQRRYAAGELTEAELERQVERLLDTDRTDDSERLVE